MNKSIIVLSSLILSAGTLFPSLALAAVTNAGDGGGAGAPTTQSIQPVTITPGIGSVQQATPAPSSNSSVGSVSETGFVPLAPIPGLTSGATADTAGLASFLNNLYKYLIGLAAALAVIMIVWGGLEISTQDSVSKKSDGKQKIYNAIFGLVLILSPVLIFSIINPTILNLSINMAPLNTQWGSSPNNGTSSNGDSGGTGTGGTTVQGCSSETGNSEFQQVSCQTSDAAQKWSDANCGGEAVLPTSCTSGQYNNGVCTSGYSVYCLGVSPASFGFVEIGTVRTGTWFTGQKELRPIDSSQNAVAGFVSGCQTNNVCFLTGSTQTAPFCDSTAFPHSFTTSVQNPSCVIGTLVCTKDNLKCDSSYVVCSSPGSCPDYK